MAPRSKVSLLPAEIQDDLNAQLIQRGFHGYEELSSWLKSLGYDISKSALHRHGSELEAEFDEAMADARRTRALAKAAKQSGEENDGSLLEAASEIIQDRLIRASMQLKNSNDNPADTAKTLSLISRAFSDLGRFEIQRQKWQAELRAKAVVAADAVEAIAKKGGLSADAMDQIRRGILGIAA